MWCSFCSSRNETWIQVSPFSLRYASYLAFHSSLLIKDENNEISFFRENILKLIPLSFNLQKSEELVRRNNKKKFFKLRSRAAGTSYVEFDEHTACGFRGAHVCQQITWVACACCSETHTCSCSRPKQFCKSVNIRSGEEKSTWR